MSQDRLSSLKGKFTPDENKRLVEILEGQRIVADNFKTYGQDYLRDLLSSGQGQKKGQGGGGMQTQQQQDQDQLKGLIVSLGGRVPQTSNIQQLKKFLAQTQRIHKLREIIPSMPEDTLTYLLSKHLNDEEVVEIGLSISEEDINFMVECVPALKNKQTLFDKLIQGGKLIPGGVARLNALVEINKNVADDLLKTTKFSRGAILKLIKKGNSPDKIVLLSKSLQSYRDLLESEPLNLVTLYSQEDRIKDNTILTLIGSGLNYYQIIEVALNFTERDLDFMVRSFKNIHQKQTLLNDIAKRIRDGTLVKIKDALETRKRDVKELSQTTGLSEDEIIQLFKDGKKKQDIQKMRGGQQQQPKKKRKLSLQQELEQLKRKLQQKQITLDDDTLKHLLQKSMNAQRISRFSEVLNTFFPNDEFKKTLQFFRLMDLDIRTKQDFIDKLLTIPQHQMETFKKFIQTVRAISETTQMKPEDIVMKLEAVAYHE